MNARNQYGLVEPSLGNERFVRLQRASSGEIGQPSALLFWFSVMEASWLGWAHGTDG